MTPIGIVTDIVPSDVITSVVEVLPKTEKEFLAFVDAHVKVTDVDFSKFDAIKTKKFASVFLSEILGITSFITGKDLCTLEVLKESYLSGVEAFFDVHVSTPIIEIERTRIINEKIVIDFVTEILPVIETDSVEVMKEVFVAIGKLVSIYSFLSFGSFDINLVHSVSSGIFDVTKIGTPVTLPKVTVPEESVVVFNELAKIISKIVIDIQD